MSILAQKTEKKAVKVLANTLRFFDQTDLMFISAEDAHKAREAEYILRGIVENNHYKAVYQKGKGTKIIKQKITHENDTTQPLLF